MVGFSRLFLGSLALVFILLIAAGILVNMQMSKPGEGKVLSSRSESGLVHSEHSDSNDGLVAKVQVIALPEQNTLQSEAPNLEEAITSEDDIFKMTEDETLKAVQGMETTVFKRADRLFQAEDIDPEWGPEYTNEFMSMFQQHLGLAKVSLKQLECRSTQCQVIVYTPKGLDADYFTAMFYDALKTYEGGKLNQPAAIARQMAMGVTSVYIPRAGHTLKFYTIDN
ncbi:hypothetical protein [Teredinibacter haidensis]|uniref:hypothetical protein n=1 Tax=Teredinibacter haidensis TaxID=2731755 RepID=UPI000948C290|nr:hypothetical protein [Teredinibacter haidensis]